jgi:hypothetical protein
MKPIAIAALLWMDFTVQMQGSHTPSCHSVTFNGQLSAGEIMEKAIGRDLVFLRAPDHLGPKGELNGWSMTVATAKAPQDDYIYPASPPLRFNPVQTFGPSYGQSTKASLTYAHEVRFLLNRTDYDCLCPLLTRALWAHNSLKSDEAGNDYVKALNSLRTGALTVTVLSYELETDKDSIRHMNSHRRASFPSPENLR